MNKYYNGGPWLFLPYRLLEGNLSLTTSTQNLHLRNGAQRKGMNNSYSA